MLFHCSALLLVLLLVLAGTLSRNLQYFLWALVVVVVWVLVNVRRKR